MTNKILLLYIFLITAFFTYAQKGVEISHYLFPEFTSGKVIMKDGTVNPALLNYNAITKEVVFLQNEQVLALADPALSRTDTVIIGDKKLVRFDKEFAEVLLEGDVKLVSLFRCKVIPPSNPAPFGGTSQISSVDSYSRLTGTNMFYELKLPEDYKIEISYVYRIDQGAGWKKVNSIRQLKRLYKQKKTELNNYLSEHELDIDDVEGVARLVEWLESK